MAESGRGKKAAEGGTPDSDEAVGRLARPASDAIDARPTKKFFVRMLVRDIELVPAIVDLVDNSVDGAKRAALSQHSADAPTADGADEAGDLEENDADATPDLTGFKVEIALDGDTFRIEDNCGGIELKDALTYAFRFGRPEDVEPIEGEVGQFGVGMKRALFKIGEWFEVQSIAATSRFQVELDVKDWLEDEEYWTFPLVSSSEGEDNSADTRGTVITVKNLLPSVAAEFGRETFQQRLRDQIEFRHQAALGHGLEIVLGTDSLRSRPLGLLAAEGLAPRAVTKDITANGYSVHMQLYAGFVKLTDEDADTDDPDQFSGGSLAGWYLICNGRMLLFADKSRLTGWGVEVADYHPQYRRFRGYVYLSGSSSAMPWNTAKTAVDEDSPIWPEVRNEIVAALREARTVMNRIKSEVQSNPADQRPITSKLDAAVSTSLGDLAPAATMTVPPKPPKQPPSTARVTFAVSRDEFAEVKATFDDEPSAAEVGRRTFDYYYRREVGD